MRIVPFSIPNVDYPALLDGGSGIAGRELGRNIDRSRGLLADTVVVLADIERPGRSAHDALQRPEQALCHLHFAFLIDAPDEIIIDLIIERVLTIGRSQPKIVSGSLSQWKLMVDRYLRLDASVDARRLFNGIYVFFERLGLGEIWGRHKKMLDDSTFILE